VFVVGRGAALVVGRGAALVVERGVVPVVLVAAAACRSILRRWRGAHGLGLAMLVAAAGCHGHARTGRSERGLAAFVRTSRGAAASGAAAGGIGVRLEWPIQARVSSPFGVRDGRPHEGVDFRVPSGTPVRAAAEGEVIYAGSGLRGYGRLLVLQHDAHVVTVYAHNSRLLVGEGARVGRGQVITLSGATGRVTAPHLHFELRIDGVARDPLPYLAPRAPRVAAAGAALVEAPTILRASDGD
jgi:murein DD-endopeptidase MepM/ murein hydrolase activator NlpD